MTDIEYNEYGSGKIVVEEVGAATPYPPENEYVLPKTEGDPVLVVEGFVAGAVYEYELSYGLPGDGGFVPVSFCMNELSK